jgi:hypothetical protein
MYKDQLIPRRNSAEAYRVVQQQILRQERRLDREDLKWCIGTAFAAWVFLVIFSIMLGAVPSTAGCMLWVVFLMIAGSVAFGMHRAKARANQLALKHLLQRGDVHIPSDALIGWVRGKAPEATQISRFDWAVIASAYIDQLRACDTVFKQTPFGETQMDEIDGLIEPLLVDLREAIAIKL